MASSNKTQPSNQTPISFIQSLTAAEQEQANVLLQVFKQATGMKPVMWGNIIGFGSYHYKYDSGREGNFLATGFAIRKNGPTVYIMPGYHDYSTILKDLGPHKLGKSCLYLKDLDNVNLAVLGKLIKAGLRDLGKKYSVQAT